jgi:hypothetical protein
MGDDVAGSCDRITLPKDLKNQEPAEIVANVRRRTETVIVIADDTEMGDFWLQTHADFGCALWESKP